jgi:hypothetical protein
MENEGILMEFLKDNNIIDTNETCLENVYIKRDTLIEINNYEDISKNIMKLKDIFSTSSITSLQDSAKTRQRWPFLNLIRQLLKINGFSMKPFRKSAGYTSSGKKKYDRYFLIEKSASLTNTNNELNNEFNK